MNDVGLALRKVRVHRNNDVEFDDQSQQCWEYKSKSYKNVGDFDSLFINVSKDHIGASNVCDLPSIYCFEWSLASHSGTSKTDGLH